MDEWYHTKENPTGEARALTESLRRLLRRRPSLSIKLMFDQLRTTKLPQAVDSLMEEFGPRLVTVDYYAVPEWAEEWHACDEF
ncbi:hypothetical protein DL93DRAFT_2088364 [Clavulina sp. PMI_390]|nr:hypothetical protein DL93DRAFT_2088364 [Clavulina sp. PMI_390]